MNVRSQRLLSAVLFLITTCLMAAPAQAKILVNDDFNRTDGPLVGTVPTPGPGAAWAAHSGAGNKPVQIASGTAQLEQSAGSGEDVNTDWATAIGTGDTIYAAFDLWVNGTTTPDDLYFAHFKTSGTFFNSRVWVTSPGAGGDYTLALSGDSSITDGDGEAVWGSDLAFNTAYRVVHSYDYDSGLKSLWVNPASQASSSITATDSTFSDPMVQYALRQNTGGNTFQTIDNLVVATTFGEALSGIPEPTSCLLSMLGLLTLGATRRGR